MGHEFGDDMGYMFRHASSFSQKLGTPWEDNQRYTAVWDISEARSRYPRDDEDRQEEELKRLSMRTLKQLCVDYGCSRLRDDLCVEHCSGNKAQLAEKIMFAGVAQLWRMKLNMFSGSAGGSVVGVESYADLNWMRGKV